MADLLQESKPTARIQHVCSGCPKPIEPGEVYSRQTIVDGSDLWTWKSCDLCSRVWSWYFYEDLGGFESTASAENVHDSVSDHLENPLPNDPDTPMLKEWAARWKQDPEHDR